MTLRTLPKVLKFIPKNGKFVSRILNIDFQDFGLLFFRGNIECNVDFIL